MMSVLKNAKKFGYSPCLAKVFYHHYKVHLRFQGIPVLSCVIMYTF